MKKFLILTSSILLIAAACNKQAAVQPVQNQTTNSTDQTENWKTYTSAKYGFQFSYPQNSELKGATEYGGEVVLQPDASLVRVKENSNYLFEVSKLNYTSLTKDVIKQNFSSSNPNDYTIISVTIAGSPGFEVSFNKNLKDVVSDFYYINHSGTVYSITLPRDKGNPEPNQILASFKFTK